MTNGAKLKGGDCHWLDDKASQGGWNFDSVVEGWVACLDGLSVGEGNVTFDQGVCGGTQDACLDICEAEVLFFQEGSQVGSWWIDQGLDGRADWFEDWINSREWGAKFDRKWELFVTDAFHGLGHVETVLAGQAVFCSEDAGCTAIETFSTLKEFCGGVQKESWIAFGAQIFGLTLCTAGNWAHRTDLSPSASHIIRNHTRFAFCAIVSVVLSTVFNQRGEIFAGVVLKGLSLIAGIEFVSYRNWRVCADIIEKCVVGRTITAFSCINDVHHAIFNFGNAFWYWQKDVTIKTSRTNVRIWANSTTSRTGVTLVRTGINVVAIETTCAYGCSTCEVSAWGAVFRAGHAVCWRCGGSIKFVTKHTFGTDGWGCTIGTILAAGWAWSPL